jgi:hypothetical protein
MSHLQPCPAAPSASGRLFAALMLVVGFVVAMRLATPAPGYASAPDEFWVVVTSDTSFAEAIVDLAVEEPAIEPAATEAVRSMLEDHSRAPDSAYVPLFTDREAWLEELAAADKVFDAGLDHRSPQGGRPGHQDPGGGMTPLQDYPLRGDSVSNRYAWRTPFEIELYRCTISSCQLTDAVRGRTTINPGGNVNVRGHVDLDVDDSPVVLVAENRGSSANCADAGG